ncbi:MAG: TRAP transporter small permease [Desulfobacterales bacterium]|nr:TRAP transporter small permease [Desulfobacterales bacterium]
MVKRIIDTVNFVTRISGILAGFMLTALMLLNSYAVVRRYGFNRPVDWILDLSEFLMVASVFMGTAYILHTEGHVTVDLLLTRLSEKTRHFLYLVTMFCVSIFTFFLTWKTWELAWDNLDATTESISQFPLFPAYIIVFYGSFLLFLQSIIKIYTTFKGKDGM